MRVFCVFLYVRSSASFRDPCLGSHRLLEVQLKGLTCSLVQEIGQQAAHDGLVTDDQHVLLPLQLHDDRLQPLHQVLIGLRHKERRIRQVESTVLHYWKQIS